MGGEVGSAFDIVCLLVSSGLSTPNLTLIENDGFSSCHTDFMPKSRRKLVLLSFPWYLDEIGSVWACSASNFQVLIRCGSRSTTLRNLFSFGCSSHYRITKLLPRIKHGNRGRFYELTFRVVDHFFPKKSPEFFETKLAWVGSGSGLGLGSGVELVCKVVLRAFFEEFFIITLEPHAGHTKFPRFLYHILDNNSDARGKGVSLAGPTRRLSPLKSKQYIDVFRTLHGTCYFVLGMVRYGTFRKSTVWDERGRLRA